jgi:hypothetical protein
LVVAGGHYKDAATVSFPELLLPVWRAALADHDPAIVDYLHAEVSLRQGTREVGAPDPRGSRPPPRPWPRIPALPLQQRLHQRQHRPGIKLFKIYLSCDKLPGARCWSPVNCLSNWILLVASPYWFASVAVNWTDSSEHKKCS